MSTYTAPSCGSFTWCIQCALQSSIYLYVYVYYKHLWQKHSRHANQESNKNQSSGCTLYFVIGLFTHQSVCYNLHTNTHASQAATTCTQTHMPAKLLQLAHTHTSQAATTYKHAHQPVCYNLNTNTPANLLQLAHKHEHQPSCYNLHTHTHTS